MATVYQTVLTLIILQIYVSAAPTDAPKHEGAEHAKLDTQTSTDRNKNVNTTENQRQKRYYNYFDFSPFAPPPFQPYNKRDQPLDTGVYGLPQPEDALNGIHRRLLEIASGVRQSVPPPPPVTPHFPFYFPVIFIPQFSCSCEPTNTQTTEKPSTVDTNNNGTSPDVENRFPDMEDERQNWGLVDDEVEDDGEDYSRPISFEPISLKPSKPKRPAPPVDHGSSQSGEGLTTTVKPAPVSNDVDGPIPTSTVASVAPYPARQPSGQAPTSCDGAVLSCCHMPQVTYDCFVALGCPDPTSYGNPCDPLVILKVINKFQNFYGVKRG